jgi:hypothetical protein
MPLTSGTGCDAQPAQYPLLQHRDDRAGRDRQQQDLPRRCRWRCSTSGRRITFDQGIIEIRDLLIDRNVIHQNTRNGIKFDYGGRLGENVVISNNAQGVQGITQNGPAPALLPAEGNGIYITARVTEVRGVQFVNNVINGNRGQYQGIVDDRLRVSRSRRRVSIYKPCRDGNGISMENSGRVEDVTFDGNDFRQNFNNGVCIANRGDFTRSTVTNNKFHNNGFGEPGAAGRRSTGALRRRLRGLPRFHRGEPRLRCSGH